MAKKKPQTARAYAMYLYDIAHTTEAPVTMPARSVIDTRVRAFVDGVNWERRRVSVAKRRAARKSEYSTVRRLPE
jgi:hypothetical protein